MKTQIATTDGPIVIEADTDRLIVNRTEAGPVNVKLPAASAREENQDLIVSDFGGNAEVTISPAEGDSIMRLDHFLVLPGATVRLSPSNEVNGWLL